MQKNNQVIKDQIKTLHWGSQWNDIEIQQLINYGQKLTFRKQKTLYYQGDQVKGAYLILSGRIKKIKYRFDETSLILGNAEHGNWLGIPELITNGLYLFDAFVDQSSQVLFYNHQHFNNLLQTTKLHHYVLTLLAREYYALHSHLESHTPMQKIIHFLLAKIETFSDNDQNGNHYIINITQDNLAEIIGYTRETVNKYLRTLADKKCIQLTRGKIIVINQELLSDFLMI